MAGTSAARVEANRKNAQKSTGPRTVEGKARARANAVKHGLTGAGIALPSEDSAVVEARFGTLQEELAPADLMGELLVAQIAWASVRIDRAARQEAAAVARTMRNAVVEFDLDRLREVDRLFATIKESPGDNRRRLLASPEGIERLSAALASAREQLRGGSYGSWGEGQRDELEALFGGMGFQFPVSRTHALLEALAGDFQWLPKREYAHLEGQFRLLAWARDGLIGEIDAELARLATARAAIDLEALEQDRLEAPDRAGLAMDRDAVLARKYGAAASRDFFRAYRDFRQNEANLADGIVEPATSTPCESALPIEQNEPNLPDEATAVGEPTEISLPQPSTGQSETGSGAAGPTPVRQNEPNGSRPMFFAEVQSKGESAAIRGPGLIPMGLVAV